MALALVTGILWPPPTALLAAPKEICTELLSGSGGSLYRDPTELSQTEWRQVSLDHKTAKELIRQLRSHEDFDYFYPSFLRAWQRRLNKLEAGERQVLPFAEEFTVLSYYEVESGHITSMYRALNHWLRKGELMDFEAHQLRSMAFIMASVLNKLPPDRLVRDQVVFRGLSLPAEKVHELYVEGQVVEDLGFMSSSLDRDVADDFSYGNMDNERVILVIRSQTGLKISNLLGQGASRSAEDYLDEQEVIFLPRTPFKVKRIFTENFRRIIELEEMSPTETSSASSQ